MPKINEKQELFFSRLATAFAIGIAGLFGIYPLAFVAQVVAFAFGLAASTLFPVLLLGIFSKRLNKEGAISGMIVGIVLMLFYMIRFKIGLVGILEPLPASEWWFGTSPEGFGTIAMVVNIVIAITVSRLTSPPPQHVQEIVENIRIPSGAGEAQNH